MPIIPKIIAQNAILKPFSFLILIQIKDNPPNSAPIPANVLLGLPHCTGKTHANNTNKKLPNARALICFMVLKIFFILKIPPTKHHLLANV